MISKEQFWASISDEVRIMKHLAIKIPEGQHHHKPTEKQRTTLELLQFVSYFGSGCMQAFLTGDTSGFAKLHEDSKSVTVANFGEAMDREEARMKELFAKFTPEELKTVITMWGRTQSKDLYLLNLLKMLTGYKMQIFLYAKQSGAHHIGTPNVWAGMDMPAPKA